MTPKHYGGYKYRNRRNREDSSGNPTRRNSVWRSIITALVGTAIKDLTSENSKIKKIAQKIFSPQKLENKQDKRKVLDADYEVVENDPKRIGKEEKEKK